MIKHIERNVAAACLLAVLSVTVISTAVAQSSGALDGDASPTKSESRAAKKQVRKQIDLAPKFEGRALQSTSGHGYILARYLAIRHAN